MATKTAVVEVTVAYKVYMDKYGSIVRAEPMLAYSAYEKEAMDMAADEEFELEDGQ